MVRTRFAALLLVPLAFMLMGARAGALVDPEPVSVPTGIAASEVAKAIKVGIVRRGWVVSKDEPEKIATSTATT